MRRLDVAFFAMPEDGHVRRLLPLVAAVAAAGARVRLWTDARFAPDAARAGAEFADLFAGRPLAAADDASSPYPCRFTTFAGVFGEEILAEVARERPRLVVYDGFAVVGRAVAARLGVPAVQACAGHAVIAHRFLAALATDPRVRVDPRCRAAAEVLRDRFGLEDASPFAYVAPPSRALNVYGEPEEWLDPADRAALSPIAFFGCLESPLPAPSPRREPGPLRVYVSFGTVVWRYYAKEALSALRAVADAVASRADVEATIALGGAPVSPADAASLSRRNVTVLSRADQSALLSSSDLFLTHHGLNSTHEAVARGVPMLSYPFFWDQPALAATAQRLGVALPLSDAPRGPLSPASVSAAIDAALSHRPSLSSALSRARLHEENVRASRLFVVQRVLSLEA